VSQNENIVKFYAGDKTEIWAVTKRLLETVEAISQLVNFRQIKNGDSWKELCDEDDFFYKAGPTFNHLLTQLSSLSIGVPTPQWITSVVESFETAPQPEPNGEEKPKSFREKLTGLPRRTVSSAFNFLSPPPLPVESQEIQRTVNTLQAEFTRLRLLVTDGWQQPEESRNELAEKVSQVIGWVHSDTFQRILQWVKDIDQIGGGVFKEL